MHSRGKNCLKTAPKELRRDIFFQRALSFLLIASFGFGSNPAFALRPVEAPEGFARNELLDNFQRSDSAGLEESEDIERLLADIWAPEAPAESRYGALNGLIVRHFRKAVEMNDIPAVWTFIPIFREAMLIMEDRVIQKSPESDPVAVHSSPAFRKRAAQALAKINSSMEKPEFTEKVFEALETSLADSNLDLGTDPAAEVRREVLEIFKQFKMRSVSQAERLMLLLGRLEELDPEESIRVDAGQMLSRLRPVFQLYQRVAADQGLAVFRKPLEIAFLKAIAVQKEAPAAELYPDQVLTLFSGMVRFVETTEARLVSAKEQDALKEFIAQVAEEIEGNKDFAPPARFSTAVKTMLGALSSDSWKEFIPQDLLEAMASPQVAVRLDALRELRDTLWLGAFHPGLPLLEFYVPFLIDVAGTDDDASVRALAADLLNIFRSREALNFLAGRLRIPPEIAAGTTNVVPFNSLWEVDIEPRIYCLSALGSIQFELKNFEPAITVLTDVAKNDPDGHIKGLAEVILKEVKTAAEIFRALWSSSDRPARRAAWEKFEKEIPNAQTWRGNKPAYFRWAVLKALSQETDPELLLRMSVFLLNPLRELEGDLYKDSDAKTPRINEERYIQREKRDLLAVHRMAIARTFRQADPFKGIDPDFRARFYGAIDVAMRFLISKSVSAEISARQSMAVMDRQRLQMEVEIGFARVAEVLRQNPAPQLGRVLFGIGPRALKAYGPLLVDILDRLRAQTGVQPMLIVIGEDAGRYVGTVHPSVLLAAETPAEAAAALELLRTQYGVERIQYLSSTQEYSDMCAALVNREAPPVEQLFLETFPAFLQRILYALAGADPSLQQSRTDPFSGINLNQLGEHLKALCELGT